jgi:hypothetical protein
MSNIVEHNVVAARKERANSNSNAAKRRIWITFQKEGIHAYPAAASDPNLSDVSFLGHPHRHIFHFRVEIEVTHNDRDIEFIQFKRWCENLYSGGTLELNSKSCEMMADDLYAQIGVNFPGRDVIIEVSEDGENGCKITYADSRSQQIKFNQE